ncbi:unnamed protein product [Arabis nemorensis]|uniref:Uncharacterized protein n=1 Tax=Arabis nemorensis TaxID=586526 RepID=A0A565B2H0_9BRAS|nr:unnamed protein product [Arabis nemorensis]
MEEEDGDASTPFWLQSRRNNTYFRRTASLGGRATTVATQVFFAGAATILIVFFIIPPLFSSVSQIFRPHLVRKSWDYLNFVLVLFAVVCGFLSRNTTTGDDRNKEEEISSNNNFSSSPSIIDRCRLSNGGGGATPRYWIDDRGGDQFPDQTVYKRFCRLRSSSSYPDLKLREFETDERWRFYDDTRVSTECRYEASDRIYQNWREVKPEKDVDPTVTGDGDGGGKILDTEKIEVVATATTTAEVVEERTAIPNPASPPHAPPPSKPVKRKIKRVYQDLPPEEEKKERAAPVTPIPPPAIIRKAPVESRTSKPNPPAKVTQFVGTGNESPLMPIPPPPPPPPFKMPAWKFVKRGDYVRMASDISISSDEPDDDPDVAQSVAGNLFCPSPDVDTKADNFITRFRAGLKLEKMNSEKRGRSNLGPEPGPDESES